MRTAGLARRRALRGPEDPAASDGQPGRLESIGDDHVVLVYGGGDNLASLYELVWGPTSANPRRDTGVAGGEAHFGAWLLRQNGGRLPTAGERVRVPSDFGVVVEAVSGERHLLIAAGEYLRGGRTLTRRAALRRRQAHEEQAIRHNGLAAAFPMGQLVNVSKALRHQVAGSAAAVTPAEGPLEEAVLATLARNRHLLVHANDAVWESLGWEVAQTLGLAGVCGLREQDARVRIERALARAYPASQAVALASSLTRGLARALGMKLLRAAAASGQAMLASWIAHIDRALGDAALAPGIHEATLRELPAAERAEIIAAQRAGARDLTEPQRRRILVAARAFFVRRWEEVATNAGDARWLLANFPQALVATAVAFQIGVARRRRLREFPFALAEIAGTLVEHPLARLVGEAVAAAGVQAASAAERAVGVVNTFAGSHVIAGESLVASGLRRIVATHDLHDTAGRLVGGIAYVLAAPAIDALGLFAQFANLGVNALSAFGNYLASQEHADGS